MTIEIQLTQGQVAFIDDCDADLAELKWHAAFSRQYAGGGKYVARRNVTTTPNKQVAIQMHRVILSRKLGRPLLRFELTDHEDLNTLNNRRDNLRIASHAQNMSNRGQQSNNKSGFKGVHLAANGKWKAQISVGGQQKHLGYFDTPEAAYDAYCKEAIKEYGKFARLK